VLRHQALEKFGATTTRASACIRRDGRQSHDRRGPATSVLIHAQKLEDMSSVRREHRDGPNIRARAETM
jgi:hypothetical protein